MLNIIKSEVAANWVHDKVAENNSCPVCLLCYPVSSSTVVSAMSTTGDLYLCSSLLYYPTRLKISLRANTFHYCARLVQAAAASKKPSLRGLCSHWCCSLERTGIEKDKFGKFGGEESMSVYNPWGQGLASSSPAVTLADVVAPAAAAPHRESHERSSALKGAWKTEGLKR